MATVLVIVVFVLFIIDYIVIGGRTVNGPTRKIVVSEFSPSYRILRGGASASPSNPTGIGGGVSNHHSLHKEHTEPPLNKNFNYSCRHPRYVMYP